MIVSEYLKESIEEMQRLMIKLPLRKFETKALGQSLRMSRIKEYEHGEVITKENDDDPCIYFLLSGKVRLAKQGAEAGMLDQPGEIFGEVKIPDISEKSASAYALGKTVCLAANMLPATNRLGSDEKADILLSLYRIFMEYLAIRLRLVTEELVKTKKEVERRRKEKGLIK